jgi:hypothetical protein
MPEACRYAGLPTIPVVLPDGTERLLTAPRMAVRPAMSGVLETPAGARLDLLAHALLGDSTRWWLLADANPWRDPTQLERPGTVVEVPRG